MARNVYEVTVKVTIEGPEFELTSKQDWEDRYHHNEEGNTAAKAMVEQVLK